MYKPYEGEDDRKRVSVLFDFEYLLKRYSVWPSKEQKDKRIEKYEKQEEERKHPFTVDAAEAGGDVSPIEPVTELPSDGDDENNGSDDAENLRRWRRRQKRPYLRLRNDGRPLKSERKDPPFLSLYKIMPTEGEIEKFIKLQKEVGFVGLGLKKASHGKRLDQEAVLKAESDPGKLVTPKELNRMARGDSSSEEETERTEYATER